MDVGEAELSGTQATGVVALFTVIAASTVAVPVVGYTLAKERMQHPLDELKVWLEQHNAAVMSVLLLVIGIDLVGKGVGGC